MLHYILLIQVKHQHPHHVMVAIIPSINHSANQDRWHHWVVMLIHLNWHILKVSEINWIVWHVIKVLFSLMCSLFCMQSWSSLVWLFFLYLLFPSLHHSCLIIAFLFSADHDDSTGKRRSTDIGEGRITPLSPRKISFFVLFISLLESSTKSLSQEEERKKKRFSSHF